MAFLHSAQLLYTDCGYPRWSVCFTLPNAIFFYMLFNDFYKVSTLITIACSGMQGEGTWRGFLCWQSVGMVSGSQRPWPALHGIINNDEFHNFFSFFFFSRAFSPSSSSGISKSLGNTQKSYTKKGKAAAKASANGKVQNGKANGHITHDINHNVTDTKPSEHKKENWAAFQSLRLL